MAKIAETCKLLIQQLKEDEEVRLKEHHNGEIRISLYQGNPSKRIKIVETKEIE